MNEVIQALEKIRKEFKGKIGENAGIIIGEERLLTSKAKVKKCLVSARLTRKAVATAAKDDVQLIITVFPPIFVQSKHRKISKENLELLRILLEKNIGVYSLGEDWLITEKGGFDYLLNLLDFEYTSLLEIEYQTKHKKAKKKTGRMGERKKKISYKELLELLKQHISDDLRYLGYSQTKVQKIAFFYEIRNELMENVHELNLDAILVGDTSYEGLLTAQLQKLSLVILEKRNLENAVLACIRRRLMEEVAVDLPEIVTLKQDQIGTS
jgi:putative NIF3 family GTP cyclohydrolase 1 type 2